MRILVVAHGFPPAAQGGSEIYASECARALRRLFSDDILVLTREADASRAEHALRMEAREGMSIAWINNTFKSVHSFAESYANSAIDDLAGGLIDEFKPDVAHIHHLTCLSTTLVDLLACRGVPIFYTLHDYWLLCHRGQLLDMDYAICDGPGPEGCGNCLGPAASVPFRAAFAAPAVRTMEAALPAAIQRAIAQSLRRGAGVLSSPRAATREAARRVDHMRRIWNQIDHFFAPSQFMLERFVEAGIPRTRISRSDYGFDHSRFGVRPHYKNVMGSDPRTVLRIGYLGSLMVSKGPHVLLEAFDSLPPGSASVDLFGAHCAYHGDASYEQRLAPLLARPGVSFRGQLPYDDIPRALNALDVLVVPSIWPENSPLVIREAFLAGLPVVASRIGGVPEAISDGVNGLLFSPGDSQDLARKLARLVNEPGLIDHLRSGIPSVRTIEDDVRGARAAYQAKIPEKPAARLAAIVLNYRTPDDTLLAVKSLLASNRVPDHIIVVNNSPEDACRTALRNVSDRIEYLEASRNLGFSGGMNVGVRRALEAGADSVLLVNSDVIVPPDCLDRLEAALDGESVGIAGPAVLSRTNPGSVASLGMTYRPTTGRMRHAGYGSAFDTGVRAIRTTDGVSGCLMLVRRRVFERAGLLDEDYFFGFEDLDLCLRAKQAGLLTVVNEHARVYHEGSRSIGPESSRRLYFATRNHLLMAERRAKRNPVAAVFQSSSILALNLAHAASGPSSRAAGILAVAKGARDYLARRFGEG